MKCKMLEPLLVEMSELELIISRSERDVIELVWKHSQLEAAIEESCVILKRLEPVAVTDSPTTTANTCVPYEHRKMSLWSVGSRGSGDGQMKEPKGLAVDAGNEDIYLADRDNNRIIVFNKYGIFLRNIESENLVRPQTILIICEYCFVACAMPNEGLIVKLDKRNGKTLRLIKPGCNITALTLDRETDLLFGCPLSMAAIWYYQQEDLEKVYELELNTTNFTSGTQIHAIETREDEIFVLFYNAHSPLQSFYRNGELSRNLVIPAKLINQAFFFKIDSQHNFIVSDVKVRVFSPIGDLISVIGNNLTGERAQGEVYGSRGIALTKYGNIIVCDGKRKNILQMF